LIVSTNQAPDTNVRPPILAWSVQTVPWISVGLSFRPAVGLRKEYCEWLND